MTDYERSQLEKFAKSRTMAHRTVLRARALLLAAEGVANNEIGLRVNVNPNSVRMWRRRFEEDGIDGVGKVAPGRGRKPSLPEGTVAEVVALTMNELPDDGSTQWSTRTLAKHVGISHVTVARIWKDHGLQPWKTDTFKVSTDPHFEEKLVDVVGLYMNPPERAVVFSFDEKTEVQALDRTQPSLPMKNRDGKSKLRCSVHTHHQGLKCREGNVVKLVNCNKHARLVIPSNLSEFNEQARQVSCEISRVRWTENGFDID
jgi:transposase